jgi:hypothetical protein
MFFAYLPFKMFFAIVLACQGQTDIMQSVIMPSVIMLRDR